MGQDFRNFFPEVALNVANKWTNSDCVESKSSDGDKDVEEDEELDHILDDISREIDSQSSASGELPSIPWDG